MRPPSFSLTKFSVVVAFTGNRVKICRLDDSYQINTNTACRTKVKKSALDIETILKPNH